MKFAWIKNEKLRATLPAYLLEDSEVANIHEREETSLVEVITPLAYRYHPNHEIYIQWDKYNGKPIKELLNAMSIVDSINEFIDDKLNKKEKVYLNDALAYGGISCDLSIARIVGFVTKRENPHNYICVTATADAKTVENLTLVATTNGIILNA